MYHVKATHLAGVALASLLAVGGQQLAQAAPMDDHHGAMHNRYARHGHYAAMHGRYAGYGHYGARYGRYAGYGHYGARYGRYAAAGGAIAAPVIPPQGYDYVGSYNGTYASPQPNYGAGGFGPGFGLGQARPSYVLPNGDLTWSLSDYYNYRGPSYSYGYGPAGPGLVGAPIQGAANVAAGTINAATLGLFGPTNAAYNPPPPPATQRLQQAPGYGHGY